MNRDLYLFFGIFQKLNESWITKFDSCNDSSYKTIYISVKLDFEMNHDSHCTILVILTTMILTHRNNIILFPMFRRSYFWFTFHLFLFYLPYFFFYNSFSYLFQNYVAFTLHASPSSETLVFVIGLASPTTFSLAIVNISFASSPFSVKVIILLHWFHIFHTIPVHVHSTLLFPSLFNFIMVNGFKWHFAKLCNAKLTWTHLLYTNSIYPTLPYTWRKNVAHRFLAYATHDT